jgi:proline racemase
MTRRVRTIDVHLEGGPLRLIVEGWPTLPGDSMRRRFVAASRTGDRLRRALFGEPRGHRDLIGAVLTEPASPGACAGLLFMSRDGWLAACGYGVMAAAVVAVERGLLTGRGSLEDLTFDTLAGPLAVRLAFERRAPERRVARVSTRTGPCRLLAPGVSLQREGGRVLADVVWAEGIRLVVDSEAARVPLRPDALEEIRRAALGLMARFDARVQLPAVPVPHRRASSLIVTGPPEGEGAALRTVSVSRDGMVDRSPSVCGAAAVLTVLESMGAIPNDEEGIACESLLGTRLEAVVEAREDSSGPPGIVVGVSGRAWITGEHVFLLPDDDPLAARSL